MCVDLWALLSLPLSLSLSLSLCLSLSRAQVTWGTKQTLSEHCNPAFPRFLALGNGLTHRAKRERGREREKGGGRLNPRLRQKLQIEYNSKSKSLKSTDESELLRKVKLKMTWSHTGQNIRRHMQGFKKYNKNALTVKSLYSLTLFRNVLEFL